MLGFALTGFVALSLLGIGVFALAAPRASARQFGIELEDPRALAFLRAMGARDLAIGALLLILAAGAPRGWLALGLAASAGIALVDFLVVARDRGPHGPAPAPARWLHALGGLGLLFAAGVVAAGL